MIDLNGRGPSARCQPSKEKLRRICSPLKSHTTPGGRYISKWLGAVLALWVRVLFGISALQQGSQLYDGLPVRRAAPRSAAVRLTCVGHARGDRKETLI
jgi:hypothetical protein